MSSDDSDSSTNVKHYLSFMGRRQKHNDNPTDHKDDDSGGIMSNPLVAGVIALLLLGFGLYVFKQIWDRMKVRMSRRRNNGNKGLYNRNNANARSTSDDTVANSQPGISGAVQRRMSMNSAHPAMPRQDDTMSNLPPWFGDRVNEHNRSPTTRDTTCASCGEAPRARDALLDNYSRTADPKRIPAAPCQPPLLYPRGIMQEPKFSRSSLVHNPKVNNYIPLDIHGPAPTLNLQCSVKS